MLWRNTSTLLNRSWKHGCSSIHDPFGCSTTHHACTAAAIMHTINVRAHNMFPFFTEACLSSPKGREEVLLAVPEHLRMKARWEDWNGRAARCRAGDGEMRSNIIVVYSTTKDLASEFHNPPNSFQSPLFAYSKQVTCTQRWTILAPLSTHHPAWCMLRGSALK